MIKFWSYKREYKKYGNIFLKKIKKTLNKGTIFFGDQLNLFERNSEKKAKGIICLPLYPELKNEELKKVCRSLRIILANI